MKRVKNLKDYIIRENKSHLLSKLVLQILIIFAISTFSIVLYDTYINIEVEDESYTAEKLSKEISIQNKEDISEVLEDISKSVVGISKIGKNDASIFSLDSEKTLSLGSGVIVTENGYILTNEHVSGAKYSKCYITLENRRRIYWESCLGR